MWGDLTPKFTLIILAILSKLTDSETGISSWESSESEDKSLTDSGELSEFSINSDEVLELSLFWSLIFLISIKYKFKMNNNTYILY